MKDIYGKRREGRVNRLDDIQIEGGVRCVRVCEGVGGLVMGADDFLTSLPPPPLPSGFVPFTLMVYCNS
jgi:hypothetical protein